MKRDEILNMPAGREMDAFIWKLLNDDDMTIMDCRFVDDDIQPYAGYPIGHISPPHYSTDISAAWEVVKKLNSLNFYVNIREDLPYRGRDEYFSGCILTQYEEEEKPFEISIFADTAPLAICRAALLTKIGNQNE